VSAYSATIHVIDANQKIRRLIEGALESHAGKIVHSAGLNEAEFAESISASDLIIMDCLQPDGDGLQWLLDKRAKGLKTPVIFLNSGSHTTEYFCRFAGVEQVKAVLHKPVTAKTLTQIFLTCCAGQKTGAAESADIDEIEREIKELSREYARELPARFQLLAQQIEEFRAGRDGFGAAKNEAHKIKGTASSYGFPEIGEQAVIIDNCLKQMKTNPESCGAEFQAKLDAAVQTALSLSDKAAAAAGTLELAPAVYELSTVPAALSIPGGQSQKIVIVDDDVDFTSRISLVLGYEDMLVYSFNDARHLADVLAFLQADLLILDLNMPDMDGFEVCRKIRQDSRWRKLPVVFLTAQTGWETRVAAFDAGADDYIPKPVVNQELIARIRVRADRSRLQDVVESQSSVNNLLWQALLAVMLQQKTLPDE
jgi:DNA-binding response OmpR family regulator